MALDLTEKTPFVETGFSLNDTYTDRTGFTFSSIWDSIFSPSDFNTDALALSDEVYKKAGLEPSDSMFDIPTANNAKDTISALNKQNDILEQQYRELKEKATKENAMGAVLKTTAAAGNLFNSIMQYSQGKGVASQKAANEKLQAQVQMEALDNQVLYAKNQLADKFNQLVERNTVTMAAKNLRVTAGNILEQTKDAAFDITQDMRTLESNAELKKISLRAQQQQADVTNKLTKQLLKANMIGSGINLVGTMAQTQYKGGYSDFAKLWGFNSEE